MIEIEIQVAGTTVRVPAETSGPLALHPALHEEAAGVAYRGDWVLMHPESGRTVWTDPDCGVLAELARELSDDPDWARIEDREVRKRLATRAGRAGRRIADRRTT